MANPTGSSGSSKMLRGFSVLLSSQLITWALTLGYTVLVPRYLGPEDMGRLSLAYAVTYILAFVLELGMIKYVTREVARDHSRAGPLLSAMLAWRIGFGAVVMGGLTVAIIVLGYPEAYRPVFYWAGLMMLAQLMAGSFDTLFRALEEFKYSARQDITIKGTIVALAIIVVVGKGEVSWIAASTAVAWLIGVGQSWLVVRRMTGLRFKTSFAEVFSLAWRSLPFWGTSVLVVLYLYLNTLMLSILAGDTEVGWYAPPSRLYQTAAFLPVALSAAVFPSLARLYLTDRPAMVALVNRNLRWVITASLPIATLCAALSPNFIILLYGEKYHGSVPVMAILGVAIIFTYINTLTDQFLVATNRQLEWTKVMVVATVANPFLNFVLITVCDKQFHNGAIGAALAFMFTEMLMIFPAYWLLPKGSFNALMARQVGRTALACIPAAAVTVALLDLPVVIPGLAGLLAFALAMYLLKALPAEEIREAKSAFLKRRMPDDAEIVQAEAEAGLEPSLK